MKKKRLLWGFAAFSFVALLVAARNMASWRPRKVAFVGLEKGDLLGGPSARLSNDGRFLLLRPFSGSSEILLVRDTSKWQLKRRVELFEAIAASGASYDVSSDHKQLAVLVDTLKTSQVVGTVSSLDGSATRLLKRPKAKPPISESWDARFSRDGRQIWAVSSHSLNIWNSANGKIIRHHSLSSSSDATWGSPSAVLSPDLQTVARTDANNLTLWDVRNQPKQIGIVTKGGFPVFSPDSQHFVCGANGMHTLVCANSSTGQTLWTSTTDRAARNIVWSRDGAEVLVLAPPQVVAFSAKTGEQLGSTRTIPCVQILPSPTKGEVWCLDISAQLWSQRVY